MPTAPAILASHWRPLLAVIAPPLALAWLLQSLITIVMAGQQGVVFHGELIGPAGAADIIEVLLWVAAWLVAAPAAVVVAAGAARGVPVGPAAAVRFALTRARSSVAVLILEAIAATLLVLLLGVVVGVLGWIGMVGLLVVVVLLGRLALALPSALLEGPGYVDRAMSVSRGRLFDSGWIFVLGFVLPPWAATSAVGLARGLPVGPMIAALIALATLGSITGIVAVQAASLTVCYLEPRPSDDPKPAADLAKVDATLITVGGREAGPGLLGLAGLAVAAPALIGLIVTLINPYAAPVLTEATVSTGFMASDDIAGVGVTPDGRPVIIAGRQITACGQPACDSVASHVDNALPGKGELSAAVVLADGSIVAVGRPTDTTATLYRCTLTSCDESALRLPKIGLVWRAAAVTITPSGRLIIAAVAEGPQSTEVVLWHCPDSACVKPGRTYIQPYFGRIGSGPVTAWNPHLAIGLDPQGRPVIAWAGGQYNQLVHMARCDDEACTHVDRDMQTAMPPITSSFPDAIQEIGGIGIDPQGKLVVAIVTHKPQQRSDINVSLGAQYDRVALVRCDSDSCDRRSAMRPWHRLDDYDSTWLWIAFARHGSPVLVNAGDDAYSVRVITCVRNCARGWS